MTKNFVLFASALSLLAVPARAAGQYTDPDSAQVAAAARKALANAKVLDIVGITLGIDAVLKDLGAKVTDQEIHIDLAADVMFDFDKHTLRPEATETLRKLGQVVSSYGDAPLLIEGHTDNKGTHAYNMKLSQNRAEAVKKWLAENAGVKPSRIRTTGWGESKPVAPNQKPDGSDDPEGRQKNRRVEIVVKKG
jgi:photosystem I P700 chlorophyll a apoprotein A2